VAGSCEQDNEIPGSLRGGEILISLATVSFSKCHCVTKLAILCAGHMFIFAAFSLFRNVFVNVARFPVVPNLDQCVEFPS
jgi:hypothetical protein